MDRFVDPPSSTVRKSPGSPSPIILLVPTRHPSTVLPLREERGKKDKNRRGKGERRPSARPPCPSSVSLDPSRPHTPSLFSSVRTQRRHSLRMERVSPRMDPVWSGIRLWIFDRGRTFTTRYNSSVSFLGTTEWVVLKSVFVSTWYSIRPLLVPVISVFLNPT